MATPQTTVYQIQPGRSYLDGLLARRRGGGR